MTPDQLRHAIKALDLNYHTAARALRMGKWGWQTVGSWVRAERPFPGPAQVAFELMLEKRGIALEDLPTLGGTDSE